MPLTATGTQVPWHNVGAAEAAKCCCPSADPLCDYTRMDAGQESWLGADWICELTPAEYAGLVAGGTWGVTLTGSRTETGTKFGGSWSGSATLSGGGTAVRSGCDQKADFAASISDTYSWVPSGTLSNTVNFNLRLQHVIGKYVAGIGTPNNAAKPYGLRMGDFTTLWPVGVASGTSTGSTWSIFTLAPTDLYYYVPILDEWFETPALPVTHPFYRGAWTGGFFAYPSRDSGARTFPPFSLGSHSITAESWSVDITWTASAP
jgi:hypothetical protein